MNAQVKVSEVVIDENIKEKLVGATVVLEETAIGNVKGSDGKFEIKVQVRSSEINN